MRAIIVGAWCLLPQIIELDQFRCILVRQQVLMDPKEILAELSQTLDELFRFVLGPLLIDALRNGALYERL